MEPKRFQDAQHGEWSFPHPGMTISGS
jgi:hypothetical protein